MGFFGLFILGLFSFNTWAHENEAPHVLPDLESRDYQKIWQTYKLEKGALPVDPQIQKAIGTGEKLFTWIKLINDKRSPENKIKLSGPGSLRGIPIEAPLKYSPSIIGLRLQKIQDSLNEEMKATLFEGRSMSSTLATSDEEFIKNAKEISRAYDHAVRWQTNMLPYMSYYKDNAKNDVRGFYYLKQIPKLDAFLENLLSSQSDIVEKYTGYLKMICLNAGPTLSECEFNLQGAIRKNSLVNFKNRYWNLAQNHWDNYFKISGPRNDVEWNSSSPHFMGLSFVNPENDAVKNFLKVNIEDEFKSQRSDGLWKLELNFENNLPTSPYIVFKRGVTPNVSGGNVITMDSNIDLSDYENSWVIRHEFGHVLRLPDCYVEFYDDKEQAGVSYQLDTTDLMCSRTGKFNERIYNELKKYYYHD